jgi:hypothetical protein
VRPRGASFADLPWAQPARFRRGGTAVGGRRFGLSDSGARRTSLPAAVTFRARHLDGEARAGWTPPAPRPPRRKSRSTSPRRSLAGTAGSPDSTRQGGKTTTRLLGGEYPPVPGLRAG